MGWFSAPVSVNESINWKNPARLSPVQCLHAAGIQTRTTSLISFYWTYHQHYTVIWTRSVRILTGLLRHRLKRASELSQQIRLIALWTFHCVAVQCILIENMVSLALLHAGMGAPPSCYLCLRPSLPGCFLFSLAWNGQTWWKRKAVETGLPHRNWMQHLLIVLKPDNLQHWTTCVLGQFIKQMKVFSDTFSGVLESLRW